MSDNAIDRRRVLQTTGIVGLSAIGISGNASAQDKPISRSAEEITTVDLVQMDQYFIPRDDVATVGNHDPMSIYKIENNEVIFNAINESILELMKNSSKVIDHKGFHKLPKVYTRKDYNYIKLADAEGDTPTDVAETPQSIQTPAIRVKPKGKTAEIGVQDIKQTMDENEEVTVTPYSNKIETYNGESTTVDAKINVMYHSGLTVKAAKILEDQ